MTAGCVSSKCRDFHMGPCTVCLNIVANEELLFSLVLSMWAAMEVPCLTRSAFLYGSHHSQMCEHASTMRTRAHASCISINSQVNTAQQQRSVHCRPFAPQSSIGKCNKRWAQSCCMVTCTGCGCDDTCYLLTSFQHPTKIITSFWVIILSLRTMKRLAVFLRM